MSEQECGSRYADVEVDGPNMVHLCEKPKGHAGDCEDATMWWRQPVPAPAEPAEELLCKVTGNTCGSDTWPKGLVCPCEPCQSWLESQPAPAEYACPRCGSKISTHICMKAEPVAGETNGCWIAELAVQGRWMRSVWADAEYSTKEEAESAIRNLRQNQVYRTRKLK